MVFAAAVRDIVKKQEKKALKSRLGKSAVWGQDAPLATFKYLERLLSTMYLLYNRNVYLYKGI